MLTPYTVEARAGIELLLGGGDGGYHVTGEIKAWNT